MRVPFTLSRPVRMIRALVVDRDDPDLARLASIRDPERFVWTILPHAARTFAACITLLPTASARAAAVAYLYCRMLDTYEDLVADPEEREAALRGFVARFGEGAVEPAAPIGENLARDRRDAGHLLLVARHELVDRVYLTLAPEARAHIRTLVREMAEGMCWSGAAFARQGGVLESDEQLARYCRHVIGQPVLFASRLMRGAPLPEAVKEDAMTVGEMIQLANVTRDIEKDLRRGISYHPRLRGDLGRAASNGDVGLTERIRSVREELMVMALQRAPAYRRLMDYLGPGRFSLTRASGVLMLLFTDRYFSACAARVGRPEWGSRRSGIRLLFAALPTFWSRRRAARVIERVERNFLREAGRTRCAVRSS